MFYKYNNLVVFVVLLLFCCCFVVVLLLFCYCLLLFCCCFVIVMLLFCLLSLTVWAQLAVARPSGVKISTSQSDRDPVAPEKKRF